jgi:hypothetical protein
LFALLSGAFAVQSAHYLEHVAQIVQIYALRYRPPEAHGLLGSVFDFEWVHFVYNQGLEILLVGLWLGYRRALPGGPRVDRRGLRILGGLALFQGYHALEHFVKLHQYLFDPFYRFGIRPPPGILPLVTGWPIFLVHFGLNTLVWAVMGWALWRLRPARLVEQALASIRRMPWPQAAGRLAGVLAVSAGLTFGAVQVYRGTHTLHVPGDFATLQAALDAAPRTATILVAPGHYTGPFVIRQSMTVRAAQPGMVHLSAAEGEAVVTIYGAHDVTVEGFIIEGGYLGVLVEESEAVTLARNRITGAWLAGIRLSRAQARIEENDISASRGPYGKGIELANTHSRPASVIAGNIVVGHAREGILLHNAEADIFGNAVIGNGLRGIAMTEMSMGSVRDNTLVRNADAAIYVVDMSVVEVHDNYIAETRPGPFGLAHAIRVQYYAVVALQGNRLDAEIAVLQNSAVWEGAIP